MRAADLVKPADLLDELQRRGVHLWREGVELRYRGSSRVLTPRVEAVLKAKLKANKRELLALVDARERRRLGVPPGPSYLLTEAEEKTFLAIVRRGSHKLGQRQSSRDAHDFAVALAMLDHGRDPAQVLAGFPAFALPEPQPSSGVREAASR